MRNQERGRSSEGKQRSSCRLCFSVRPRYRHPIRLERNCRLSSANYDIDPRVEHTTPGHSEMRSIITPIATSIYGFLRQVDSVSIIGRLLSNEDGSPPTADKSPSTRGEL